MSSVPHELAWGDVLFSPVLPVFALALLGAWLSVGLLNKLRLSRYIMFPSVTFLALMATYIMLMNAFWLRI
ncbi:MAG: DUF1656 domain-containing protein [Halioglobus sp.]|nr:DUF1656 domain-containing protein [Halioglobus sp.]|tara:strand:+ start:2832 stop:3044 length:213 start_codon:yes stop_codon:yes gene_type:complete